MTSDRVRVRVMVRIKVSVPRPAQNGIRRNGIRRNGVEPTTQLACRQYYSNSTVIRWFKCAQYSAFTEQRCGGARILCGMRNGDHGYFAELGCGKKVRNEV